MRPKSTLPTSPGGLVHLHTESDLRVHDLSLACWCAPQPTIVGRAIFVYHTRADGET
jgi:hypothetical protein